MTRRARYLPLRPLAVAAGAALCLGGALAAPASAVSIKTQPLQHVQLLAINDLHGNLQPPSGGITTGTDANGKPVVTPAGGFAYLSTHLQQLRAGHKDTLTVASGDDIGASPLLSAAFHDEPTIEAMNAAGVAVSAVGNHEFDEGVNELLRIQKGGCIRDGAGADNQNSCPDWDNGGKKFRGAQFDYLAANVVYTKTGQPILAATAVKRFSQHLRVGFIGVVTKTTPSIVTASGVQGLDFLDEAQVINTYAAKLQAQGVQAIVALIHEGGAQTGPYNGCQGLSEPIVSINAAVSPAVDLLLTGHSHAAYNCRLTDPAGNPRLVTQAANYGKLITDVDLVIDRKTGDVDRQATTANNVIVTRDVAPDPKITSIIDKYTTYLGPLAGRVLGTIGSDLTRTQGANGESQLGDILADAAREDASVAGRGPVQIGFINPGGIRDDLLLGDGQVTYGEAFSVQPFSNYVVSKTLTGDQVKTVLEQQFDNPLGGQTRFLGVSGLTYSWSASAPAGAHVSDIRVGGVPIDPAGTYRVAGNNFLLEGGDNFKAFKLGTDPLYGGIDIDAFAAYLSAHSPVAAPALDRVTRLP
ncbi:5'-nucleotidase [Motilibacter rhizosphaerae]|uniref:5'-nucleotidase n=1 Tax=Motilibacter rhizosphaerae TaxID=598652 RepID=A0A4Q7NUC4_9ACTN|nr:bifunctional metallophosphatase/5'-nucleotidase [Motilibacter rhizosphaerae]RZS90781.1 5'-nucleotidase [Motilibacter rhizosphaerae]